MATKTIQELQDSFIKDSFKMTILKARPKSTGTIRFQPLNINSLYPLTIRNFLEDDPPWWLKSFNEITQRHQGEYKEEYELQFKCEWEQPVAVAGRPFFIESEISAVHDWVLKNITQVKILENYPMWNRYGYLFYDWEEAIQFKLTWVDK